MQHGFGVGFGLEDDALFLKGLAQFAEILDDSVVDDRKAFGRMRMRVVFGRLAVSSPAGMADAGMPPKRRCLQPRFQVFQLTLGAPPLEPVAFERCDAG